MKDVQDPLIRSTFDEWLVTDGLGGYAMGTVEGPPARSYHGLLVAALRPPVDRTVLVGGLEESVVVDGVPVPIGAPSDVRIVGRRPVFTIPVPGGHLEKTVWMEHGAPTTYVRYAVPAGAVPIELVLAPLVTERDHHAVHREVDGIPAGPVRILAPGATRTPDGRWVRDIHLAEETARGLRDVDDLWAPVRIEATVRPGAPFTLILTAATGTGTTGAGATGAGATGPPREPVAAHAAAVARDDALLRLAGVDDPRSFTARLVLAADAFIVGRAIAGVPDGRTVIAGYPWFNDWGRDTMIALPGLCLATGRADEAATILRSFARFERDGLIPNDFPDDPAREPAYHTVDATLWFVQAIEAYRAATGDGALVDVLLPTLRAIVDHHIAGTRFGIGMDPVDGLLRSGTDGVQLTWMDAKVDDWVVTPRRGKPVEIQALWINALHLVAGWADEPTYRSIAAQAEASFRRRFWRPDLGHLLDVVDGPDGDDPALRPNQLLALSLPHPTVSARMARSILAAVDRELHVPLGLRSLSPHDPAYLDRYQGDRYARDGAYHQGTVWTWLIGPYADAVARFGGGPAAALEALRPFEAHLDEAGLGSVSEILEPEPPFRPRGAPFQAWGVAEVLRAWRAYGGG